LLELQTSGGQLGNYNLLGDTVPAAIAGYALDGLKSLARWEIDDCEAAARF
jgi:hypothetical protein